MAPNKNEMIGEALAEFNASLGRLFSVLNARNEANCDTVAEEPVPMPAEVRAGHVEFEIAARVCARDLERALDSLKRILSMVNVEG